MSPTIEDSTLLNILRAVAATDPQPWYPAAYAQEKQVERKSLATTLNELRHNGLVRLTDWQPSIGQGYLITTEGRRVLNRPALISKRPAQSSETDLAEQPTTPDVPVTRTLVAVQAGVFVLGMMQLIEQGGAPNTYLTNGDCELMRQLGVSRVALANGAWWTLLSYALVHGGLPHLCLNLFGHLFDARLAELMYGRWRFIVLYGLAVFAGGVGAVLAAPNALTIGSSGGLCGVIAAQLVWVLANRSRFTDEERKKQTRDLIRAGILITAISLIPGISWGGHLGGAIGGGLAAWLTLQVLSENPKMRWMSRTALFLLPVGTVLLLWLRLR
jgi:membrane associated rhomboid family serine protease